MGTATATITLTTGLTSTDVSQKLETVYGTIAVSASPDTYATGGLTLSFSANDKIKSNSVPVWVNIQSAPSAGTSPSGYVYQFCPGTDLTNGKMAIFESAGSAAAMAELGSGASIPAGVSGDHIVFEAKFPRL